MAKPKQQEGNELFTMVNGKKEDAHLWDAMLRDDNGEEIHLDSEFDIDDLPEDFTLDDLHPSLRPKDD